MITKIHHMEKFITFQNIAGDIAPEHQLVIWSDTPDMGGDKNSVCFWHTKRPTPNYSLKDYILEYGAELIEVWDEEAGRTKFQTILNFIKTKYGACRTIRHGEIKLSTAGEGGFVYYADYDKGRASGWMPDFNFARNWAKNNGIALINN